MNRKRLAVWAGVALVAALNVYAYDFHNGDIITYYTVASTGQRSYDVFDVNMNYQTNILTQVVPTAATTNSLGPQYAICGDGLHPGFWVAYAGYTNSNTNLMLRFYGSPTSFTDIVSSIGAVTSVWGIARGRDKFYIPFMATAVLKTNYFTNRGGFGDVTMAVNQVVSYNFRNSTWGTPFYLLNTNGQVMGDMTNFGTGYGITTTTFFSPQPGYLAASNELWVCAYAGGSYLHYFPDSTNPSVQSLAGGYPPGYMLSNCRGLSAFSATQFVGVCSTPLGAAIWNPYNTAQSYVVMPGMGYQGQPPLNISWGAIMRLADGRLFSGAVQNYVLCDPVTGLYTIGSVPVGGVSQFAQTTWPARGTVVNTR